MQEYNEFAVRADRADVEAGFVNRVFGWMTVGLAVTGFVAYEMSGDLGQWVVRSFPLFLGLLLAELGLVVFLSMAIRKIPPAAAFFCFMLYAVLNGVTLSVIFRVYTPGSVTQAFFTAGVTFGVMGLFGWITRRDLTSLGSFCLMGLVGLIVASLINLFTRSSMFDLLISCAGILIFVGLTAYDTQKIKRLATAIGEGTFVEADARRAAVIGALQLYLDFINLFLYILRLFGRRR